MLQHIDIEDAAGKTIKDYGIDDTCNELILVFTDGTYARMVDWPNDQRPFDLRFHASKWLVVLGIATQDEVDAAESHVE